MKKIVYIVLGVLVLGGAVFLAINSRNKSTDNKQYGILNPNPNAPIQFPEDTNKQEEQKPEEKQPEPKPEPKPAPRGESPKPTTAKPKVLGANTTTTKPVVSTTNTYRISELNLEIVAPASWQMRLEEGKGNIVAFYSAEKQVGQIEVFVGANQSFESLHAELAANTNISNLQQISVNGIPAFRFNDKRYGNQINYAFVKNNNVYYLRGVFTQEQYFKNVKF